MLCNKNFFLLIIIFYTKLVFCENPEVFFSSITKIENPLSIRDPFKEPFEAEEEKLDVKKGVMKGGVFTNIQTSEDINADQFIISGVVIGEERRALAQLKDGQTIILKEGMIVGKNNSEIKAILPGGIVLVEKIVNVYGQDEYIETVIPVTVSDTNKKK